MHDSDVAHWGTPKCGLIVRWRKKNVSTLLQTRNMMCCSKDKLISWQVSCFEDCEKQTKILDLIFDPESGSYFRQFNKDKTNDSIGSNCRSLDLLFPFELQIAYIFILSADCPTFVWRCVIGWYSSNCSTSNSNHHSTRKMVQKFGWMDNNKNHNNRLDSHQHPSCSSVQDDDF